MKPWRIIILPLTLLALTAGCNSSKPLPLQSQFGGIIVSQSSAAQVLSWLDQEAMLTTENAVSVFNKHGYSRELGIVRFNSDDSLVLRKDYIQVRTNTALPPFTREKLNFLIQTVVPDDLLNEPLETNMRNSAAIMQHCREVFISDAQPFLEDQKTFGLVGLARKALQEAMLQFNENPRRASELLTNAGFTFNHSVYGESVLRLRQGPQNIYTLTMTAADWVDPFNLW